LLALYIGFMYLTLPWAKDVIRWVNKSRTAEEFGFIVNVILVVSASVLLGYIGYKNIRRIIYVLVPVIGLLFLAFSLKRPEERIHFFEYFVLGLITRWAIQSPKRQIIFVIAVGVVDEVIQYLLPQRVGDLRDVFFNALGSVTGLWSGWVGF